MRIAIIGTGISGLGAAYLLSKDHNIVVYEENSYVGGHSRTIDVVSSAIPTPVDTGFIVFNDWNYPNLMALFNRLGVDYEKSDMSFGVSIDKGNLEYSSNALFAQKKNIFSKAYWGMVFDILKFNRKAPAYIDKDPDLTLEECLDQLKMGDWFRHYYLLAMGAAIWSCPLETIHKFPAKTFLQFFKNHGLLNLYHRPQWYTVTGGSRNYINKLTASFRHRIITNCGVRKVLPIEHGFKVLDSQGGTAVFDEVIFACHADTALELIDTPTEEEQAVLGAFDYQENQIIVHRDDSFMPRAEKCWSSWVYLSEEREAGEKPGVSLSYWMNNLQNLDLPHPVIVTLNPARRPAEEHIFDEHVFSHPVFDAKAIQAQKDLCSIQGARGLWFCGAYQRYGFHEDGLLSAINIAKAFEVEIPWE